MAKPTARWWVRLMWVLLIASVLFWPVFRMLPEDAKIDVLGDLSVLALIFTALGNLVAAKVRKKQEDDDAA